MKRRDLETIHICFAQLGAEKALPHVRSYSRFVRLAGHPERADEIDDFVRKAAAYAEEGGTYGHQQRIAG